MNWLRSSRLTSVHLKCFLVRKVYNVKHRKTKQTPFMPTFQSPWLVLKSLKTKQVVERRSED
jgi:hypothetical protein